uniref:DUF898 family protein n=1 Tax=Acinetobacter baumannii TaxID=470 RepID=UPI0013D84C07
MTDVPGQGWPISSAQGLTAAAASTDQHAAATAAMGMPVDGARVSFAGQAGTLLPVLAQGFCLQAITLGIYRFWLITDTRRFYWSNTAVGDAAISYTG